MRDRFWVDTDAGHHLAIALDGAGRAVDGLGSNMGHVLGTGALTPDEAASVAATVTGAELLDDFGVRTFGTGNGGFNPIGYHTGSIWTHDTAITAIGLSREGFGAEASTVARTLLASAEAFSYRWPELYSGLAARRCADALPGVVPAAGLVGGLRRRAAHRGAPPATRRGHPHAAPLAGATRPLRRAARRGTALLRRPRRPRRLGRR